MPIKVLIIIHRIGIGGSEQRLLDLLKHGINNRDISYSVICIDEIGIIGQEISMLGIDLGVLQGDNYISKCIELYAYLKEIKPNVVHFHLWPSRAFTPIVRVYGKANIVYTIEDQQDFMKFYERMLEKIYYCFTDIIIAVSNSVKKAYSMKISPNSKKVIVIYGGVDLAKYDQINNRDIRKELGISYETTVITTVSRIVETKGHIYLVRAAGMLKDKYSNIKFVIVGEGNWKEIVLREIMMLGLENMFVFMGYRRDINDILNQSDIFVLPSIREGQGIAIVEAMASGTAVVTTDIEGINEVADHSNSMLVPPRDFAALARAIEEMIINLNKRFKQATEAKRAVSLKFSIQSMCANYEKIYLGFLCQRLSRNVLFYEPSSGLGGSANALANLINSLNRKKYYPIVAINNRGSQFEKINDTEIIKLRWFKVIRLYLLMKMKRISLVHVNTNIISGIPVIIAAKIAGIPCVCHIRQTRPLIRRERYFAKWVDKFIVLNTSVYEMLKKNVPHGKLKIVYDGIDLDKFCAAKVDFNGHSCIGTVNRLVEGKGLEDFITASATVARNRPKARFVIVGGDPTHDKRIEKRLKSYAVSLGLNGNMEFTGWRSDIQNIASSFDIAVQPYTSPEGLPNAMIEEMALGKPTISTNISGPSEIVIDSKTGILVPPNNPKTLAMAILKLIDDPVLARRMGEAGRKRAEEMFDIKKNVKKIEAVYDEVINI